MPMIPPKKNLVVPSYGEPNKLLSNFSNNFFQLQEQELGMGICQKLFPLSQVASTQATHKEPDQVNKLPDVV
jgi:hypothetical protein